MSNIRIYSSRGKKETPHTKFHDFNRFWNCFNSYKKYTLRAYFFECVAWLSNVWLDLKKVNHIFYNALHYVILTFIRRRPNVMDVV